MKVIVSPAPVRDQIRHNIRKLIMEGNFKPGQKLKEKELCDLLGVSRTPIREALRELGSEGLVKVLPNKGPYVAKYSIDEIKEIYEVRKILEAHASKLFVEKASKIDLSKLKEAFNALEKEILKGSVKNLLKRKEKFYNIMMEGSKNKILASFHSSLRTRIAFLRKASLATPNRPLKSLEELRKIIEAIERREPSAAWDYSITHVEKARDVLIKYLAEK